MVTRYDVISSKWSSNTFYESKNFSDSSVHHILESENFSFPFSERNWLTWVKYKIYTGQKQDGEDKNNLEIRLLPCYSKSYQCQPIKTIRAYLQ